jgi:starch synthase
MDVGRFLFFSAASLAFVKELARDEGWKPAIYHVHDWHTAYVPYLLHTVYSDDAVLGRSPTLFSIHNLRYQGWGASWHFERAKIPPVNHPLLQAMGRTDNSLAIGLAYATMLNTVSPTYAEEITTDLGGFGLDGLLHARLARLVGILNGIDAVRWNPANSVALVQPFDGKTLDRRVRNKTGLQAELGLPLRTDVPMIGAIMRLVEQKGTEILFPAMRQLLTDLDVQFVLLGSGQYDYEKMAWWLGHDFPSKVAIRLAFDETLAERIYAASDIFVMPSVFEPCGIGQMIAMRYGSIPVVRAVGGLIDTVKPDVGFLFNELHAGALQYAINEALDVYRLHPKDWQSRQQRAMTLDYSWERSARRYVELYEKTIALRKRYA